MLILIVDDEQHNHTFMERLCRRVYGAPEVAHAETADEAEAIIDEREPDLVLCDFNLRDGSTGGQLFAAVLERRPHMARRWVMLSGNVMADDLGVPCCPKPFDYGQFSSAVRAVAP